MTLCLFVWEIPCHVYFHFKENEGSEGGGGLYDVKCMLLTKFRMLINQFVFAVSVFCSISSTFFVMEKKSK